MRKAMLAAVAVIFALATGSMTPAAYTKPKPRTLVVQIQGLPKGTTAKVHVTGPKKYHTSARTRTHKTFRHLRPGHLPCHRQGGRRLHREGHAAQGSGDFQARCQGADPLYRHGRPDRPRGHDPPTATVDEPSRPGIDRGRVDIGLGCSGTASRISRPGHRTALGSRSVRAPRTSSRPQRAAMSTSRLSPTVPSPDSRRHVWVTSTPCPTAGQERLSGHASGTHSRSPPCRN